MKIWLDEKTPIELQKLPNLPIRAYFVSIMNGSKVYFSLWITVDYFIL